MTSDSWYYVSTRDWPLVSGEDRLSAEQVLEVLEQVPNYFQAALTSLADTVVPPASGDEFKTQH